MKILQILISIKILIKLFISNIQAFNRYLFIVNIILVILKLIKLHIIYFYYLRNFNLIYKSLKINN